MGVPKTFERTPDVVVVSSILLSLWRTRLAFDAKGVFRYCWHAVTLMGVTGLALPTMSSLLRATPKSQPARLSLPHREIGVGLWEEILIAFS